LTSLLSSYGEILRVNVINDKGRGFAYVDFHDSSNIQKCITTLNHTKWKGGVLRLEKAKVDQLVILQKEREERKKQEMKAEEELKNKIGSISSVTGKYFEPKSPKQWVKLRGEFLPILKLSKKTGKNTFVYNPQHHPKVKQLYGDPPPLILEDIWKNVTFTPQKRKRENDVINIISKQRRLSENSDPLKKQNSEPKKDNIQIIVDKPVKWSKTEKSGESSSSSSSDTEEFLRKSKKKIRKFGKFEQVERKKNQ